MYIEYVPVLLGLDLPLPPPDRDSLQPKDKNMSARTRRRENHPPSRNTEEIAII